MDNIKEALKLLAFIAVPILLFFLLVMNTYSIDVYTNASVHRLWEFNDSNYLPSGFVQGTKSSSWETALRANDNNPWESSSNATQYPYQRYNMTVLIGTLDWLYGSAIVQHNGGSPFFINMSIWNITGQTWEELDGGYVQNGTQDVLVFNLTSDADDYVNSTDANTINILIGGKMQGGVKLGVDYLYINYSYVTTTTTTTTSTTTTTLGSGGGGGGGSSSWDLTTTTTQPIQVSEGELDGKTAMLVLSLGIVYLFMKESDAKKRKGNKMKKSYL